MARIKDDIKINISAGANNVTASTLSTPIIITRESITLGSNSDTYLKISSGDQVDGGGTTASMVKDMFAESARISEVYILVLGSGDNILAELEARKGDEWFVMMYANSTATTEVELGDIKIISDFAQSSKKVFFTSLPASSVGAPDVLNQTIIDNTNSIRGNDRTLAMVVEVPGEHIEAPWLSRVLSQPIGSVSFAPSRFSVNFAGKTTDTFTASQSTNIRSRRGIMYVNDGGINRIDRSNTLTDYETDNMVTAFNLLTRHWVVLNSAAAILSFLSSASNPRMVDSDIQSLLNLIESRALVPAMNRGVIAPISGGDTAMANMYTSTTHRYSITAPTRARLEKDSPVDVAAGHLKGVKVEYVEAGSIASVSMNILYF